MVLKTRTGGNLSVWSNFFSGCFGENDHFHSFSPSSFFTLLAQVLPRVHTDSGKVTDGQGVAVSQTCRRCTSFNEALPANAVSHLIWYMLSVEHMIDINGSKIFLMISNNNILSHGLVMLSWLSYLVREQVNQVFVGFIILYHTKLLTYMTAYICQVPQSMQSLKP